MPLCGRSLLVVVCALGWSLGKAQNSSDILLNSTRTLQACVGRGVTVAGYAGRIRSPRAPGSSLYPNNARCAWQLKAPEGRRISLRSTLFDLERSEGCEYDYVQFFDGADDNAILLGKLCGRGFPPEGLNSSRNVMYVKFRSDSSFTKAGFHLHFSTHALPPTVLVSETVPDPPMVTCGGRRTSPSGHITSPGYGTSKTYRNNAKCLWVIDAGENKVVKVAFLNFDVEYSTDCLYDSVAIYDGPNTTSPLIDTYCGSHLPDIFKSTGQYVTVVFVSDSSVQRAGFRASYSTESRPVDHPTIPGCHSASRPAVLRGKEGKVGSPVVGPKSHYPDKTICQWRIEVQPKKRVHVHFTRFSLEPDNACRYDTLELFDGRDTTAQSLGRYCGGDIPGDITATNNTLLIQFRSDDSVTARGFSAIFSAKEPLGGHNVGNGSREPACGIPQFQPKFARIVGGTEALPYSWPWQVSVRYFDRHYCGGSIIARRWVLTAAHCLVGDGYIKDAVDYSVRLGEHNQQVFEGREQNIPVSRIIIHPKYNARLSLNDIALLYLKRDIRYNNAVLPVCLPRRDAPTDLVCVTTGWGQTQGTADPRHLNQVRVPIIARSTCRRPDWYSRRFTDVMTCAGYPEGGKDSCQGDSGGPLVCGDNGVYRLQGITSWGFGCAKPKAPGIYTRVPRFINWIDTHTNGNYQAPP